MFVRSEAQDDTALRVRHARAVEDVRVNQIMADEEQINAYVRARGLKTRDLRSTNPLQILVRAAIPVAASFVALTLMIGMIPTGSDPHLIAARLLPAAAYPSGTILGKTDTATQSGDHQIFVAGGAKTTLLVWDYAYEDGDMVSVLVNGQPMSDSFVITHAPRVITVPANSKVQVVGTFDGGGGITYAVNFPDANSTIFNGVSSGKTNTYLVKPVAGANVPGAVR